MYLLEKDSLMNTRIQFSFVQINVKNEIPEKTATNWVENARKN
jgi:hypothetical protein